MRGIANVALVLGGAVLLSACCPGRSYSGPGTIHRTCGLLRNFKVHFDVSEMAAGDSRRWSFRRFPELKSVIGFTVRSRSGLTCPQLETSSLAGVPVELELRSSAGDAVASMSGPLSDWIWSYGGGGEQGCFLYAQALYFVPSPAAAYELSFSIGDGWPPDASLDSVSIGSYASYSP